MTPTIDQHFFLLLIFIHFFTYVKNDQKVVWKDLHQRNQLKAVP